MLFLRTPRETFGLPAFWQGITGALLDGETFHDAAEREVREETGFEGVEFQFPGYFARYPIKPQWRVHFGEGPDHVEERAAFGRLAANAKPRLSDEHSRWGWFRVPQARELLSTGHNLQSFNSVLEQLMAGKERDLVP
jgi:8-oxo-dGTP pyrophosphatase MutT (NUDIX family)